ncbi:MAG TPA: class I SAM-dependent methyltransferase [Kofleriaceae bacterium]
MSDAALYGDTWASVYDDVHAADPTAAVDALAHLAGAGPALELGVGTGRIAIPLAARGVTVHAIEASQAMIDRLRAKPGGDAICITRDDFTTVAVAGEFTLIYIVASTLYGLLTHVAQLCCVRSAAAHLAPTGVLVVEAFVPDPARLAPSEHDPVAQRISSVRPHGGQRLPIELRYIWPDELDELARVSGLRLRERWCDWNRGAYTASGSHVSIYERA